MCPPFTFLFIRHSWDLGNHHRGQLGHKAVKAHKRASNDGPS